MDGLIPTIAWLDASQAGLVARVAELAGLRIVAAGGPRRGAAKGRSPGGEPAVIEGATGFDDLRHATATIDARLLLAATSDPSEPGRTNHDHALDAEILKQCRGRSVLVVSLEPAPGSVVGLTSARGPTGAGPEAARFVPLLAHARSWANTSDALANFGAIRTVSIAARCAPGEGTLGGRLFDAMHLLHQLLGTPEQIDAAVVAGDAVQGLRPAPAETVAGLRGDLTANLRFAGGRAASLSLSDRAGPWFRAGAVLGEGGSIRFTESGFEHLSIDGALVDESPARPKAGSRKKPAEPVTAAGAIAEQIVRGIDPHAPPPEPYDLAAVLAMCEAAVLSARTGQPESPETILRMAGV